jgi:hypothetical protein
MFKEACSTATKEEGNVVLSLFAGSGAFDRQLRLLGYGVLAIDIQAGQHCNLFLAEVQQFLLDLVRSDRVCGFVSGTPRSTFSINRSGKPGSSFPRKLRSLDCPRGIAGLSPADEQILKRGNQLADDAGKNLEVGKARGLCSGEENPASSFLWLLKSRQSMCKTASCNVATFDQCAFGDTRKKATTIVAFIWPLRGFGGKLCGVNRHCRFSKNPHQNPCGTNPNGGYNTLIAAQYPLRMAVTLAAEFDRARARIVRNMLYAWFFCTRQRATVDSRQ